MDAINNANYNYPRSSIPKPGFVAGPCLEKDAYILAETIKDTQLKHYIKLIRQSNESLEGKVAEKIINDLSNNNDKKVLISGLSFKGQPETSDLRGSSSINILNEIPREYVDRVELHDFMVNINEMPDNLNFILRNNIDFFIEDLPNFQSIYILNNNLAYKDEAFSEFISYAQKNDVRINDIWNITETKNKKTLGNIFID